MDFQIGFNIALGLVAFLGGWIMNNFRDTLIENKSEMNTNIKDLYDKDAQHIDRLRDIHVMVAGQYVKREELEKQIGKLSDALFHKLDKIENKLDEKIDKRDQQ